MEQDLILRIMNVIILIWVVYKTKKVIGGIECMHDRVHVVDEGVNGLGHMLDLTMKHLGLEPESEAPNAPDLDKLVQGWDDQD
jgi:hypothetical protein